MTYERKHHIDAWAANSPLHYHQTFKSMRLGGLVIIHWRISSPGIYMVLLLISPLFLFLILTVQLLVKKNYEEKKLKLEFLSGNIGIFYGDPGSL